MSDELTPEEKEALKNLPSERMPGAGLESRVVGAMRDHGFLAKRRRAIQITNSRVAGVLAAGVALMIGAYSIGLHRGGGEEAFRAVTPDGNQVSGTVTPEGNDERGRLKPSTPNAPRQKVDPVAAREGVEGKVLEKERPASNEGRADAQAEGSPGVTSHPLPLPESVRGAPSNESKKDLVWQLKREEEGLASEVRESATSSPREAARFQAAPEVGSDRAPAPQPSAAPLAGKFTFMLNGKAVVVEAPDSVRVVRDERGRMLLIYTSDGVIRIYLD